MFSFVDLFAGCGGLSLGLMRNGGQHLLAVEKSPMAAETYYENLLRGEAAAVPFGEHSKLSLVEQVRAGLFVGPLGGVLRDPTAMGMLADSDIDLVAGGPPCQGFSLAGRRRSSDPRNGLAWEFLDFVRATRPKMVLIENVVGMNHSLASRGSKRTPFGGLKTALGQISPGYVVQGVRLNALHYGAPQTRPRLMILGVRQDIAARSNVIASDDLWVSESDAVSVEGQAFIRPVPTGVTSPTVRDALARIDGSGPRLSTSGAPRAYADLMKNSTEWGLPGMSRGTPVTNHVQRKHRESTKDAFRLLQILTAADLLQDARRIRHREWSTETRRDLLELVSGLQYPQVSPDKALSLGSATGMAEAIETHLSRKHSQTVLDWDKPAKTVVTIPDDYLHPSEPRTFTVRELARFQGFPDSFQFYGKVTTGGTSRRTEVPQYSQVGNAVSPLVASAIGLLVETLLDSRSASDQTRAPAPN